MIIGTTLIHDGTGTTPYYSPQFPRGGLAATFAAIVSHRGGSPTLVIRVEHKNSEETSWGVAGTFDAIDATGPATPLDVTNLKEEVRLAFTFSAGSLGNFVHVVIPMPAWRPYP